MVGSPNGLANDLQIPHATCRVRPEKQWLENRAMITIFRWHTNVLRAVGPVDRLARSDQSQTLSLRTGCFSRQSAGTLGARRRSHDRRSPNSENKARDCKNVWRRACCLRGDGAQIEPRYPEPPPIRIARVVRWWLMT